MTLLLIRRGPNLAAQALPDGPSGERMLLMLAGAMVAGDADVSDLEWCCDPDKGEVRGATWPTSPPWGES